MNEYFKLGILLLINLIMFKIGGLFGGLIGLAIVVIKTLNLFGLTRGISFGRGSIQEGIAYTKDYIGPYTANEKAFEDAMNLIETFKLEGFGLFAIYFDKPGEVEESKMRASIGIYKINRGFPDKMSDEFERFISNNGYNYNELPLTTALSSEWKYFNRFTMMQGIKKYYEKLAYNLKDNGFLNTFRLKGKEKDLKVVIEYYDISKKVINFYVPFVNTSKFLVFKKDK